MTSFLILFVIVVFCGALSGLWLTVNDSSRVNVMPVLCSLVASGLLFSVNVAAQLQGSSWSEFVVKCAVAFFGGGFLFSLAVGVTVFLWELVDHERLKKAFLAGGRVVALVDDVLGGRPDLV